MDDGVGFLLRPVAAGMCKYESLLDGTLTLYDIALMNDYLDVKEHNRYMAETIARQG